VAPLGGKEDGMPHRTTHRSPLARTLAASLLVALLAAFGLAFADVGVGLRAIDQGDLAGAIEAFEAAIAADSDDATAHLLLGRAAVYAAAELAEDADTEREALFARAAAIADRAAELAPEDPDAHFEVARALGRLAQYRGVLQSLNPRAEGPGGGRGAPGRGAVGRAIPTGAAPSSAAAPPRRS
jgi:tetratricopeptide (TPR) repeat protein